MRRGATEEEKEEPGVSEEKQKPHTEMWGKSHRPQAIFSHCEFHGSEKWRFLEIGVPLQPSSNGIFPDRNQPFWGTPMAMETPNASTEFQSDHWNSWFGHGFSEGPVECDQQNHADGNSRTEAIWERTKNVGAKEHMMTKIGEIK